MPGSSILDCDLFDLADRTFDVYPESIPFEDFGTYHLLSPIGKGGMAEVFLAKDQEAGRLVAIKFLRNLWDETDLRQHFSREIQVLAKLEHSYIARLYEFGIHPNGTPFFVLEYVEGKPLDEYCAQQQCSLQDRLRLFSSVCEAVSYAHSRAVIHLDLKPSNILVTADGTPKLLDFGIAKHLEKLDEPVNQTQLRCTPAYAAPEQIRRQPVGTFTDVYALGVVLYELLAGKHPYAVDGCTAADIEFLIAGSQQPAKPSASATRVKAGKAAWNDLDQLVCKAVQKDVNERYRSVVELSQDLERFARGEPLKARPRATAYRVRKFLFRNRHTVLPLAAVISLIAGLIIFYTIRLRTARDAALAQSARTQRIQQFMLSLFGGDSASAPASDLRVIDFLDRGVQEAELLKGEPAVQAEVYETLGSAYHNLGKLDQADSLLQSSLNKRRAQLGPDDPAVADSLVALSALRTDQAKFVEAERLARRAIDIDSRRLAADDPEFGAALAALGAVLVSSGRWSESRGVLEQAVRIESAANGNPGSLSDCLAYLSTAENRLGQTEVAETLDRRVLSLDRRIHGDRNPRVAEDLSNLSQLQEQIGLYAEAEQSARQSVAIGQAWYGRNHFEVALLSEALGETLVYQHRYAEAAELLNNAIQIQKTIFGPQHPYIAFALNSLGVIAMRTGDLNEAEKDFKQMDSINRSAYGVHNPRIALGLLRFGQLSAVSQNYRQAEDYLHRAVQLYSELLGASHFQTGVARIELGDILLREHRYPEAEKELLTGYAIVMPGRQPSFEPAVNARRDLVSLYAALNRPDDAAKFRNVQAVQ